MPKMTLFNEHEALISITIGRMANDPIYSKIMNSSAFRRLRYISFLGAIDYARPFRNLKKSYRTRYAHSLGVAALAFHICKKKGYTLETERNIVCAALLHDIGHAPLSHSMEPAFKARWGIGHHEIGTQIITGEHSIGREISGLIKDKLDLNLILDLISGKGSSEHSELFNSPINIDTIDGILRSTRYLKNGRLCFNSLKVCEAAFLNKTEESINILDEFWGLKDLVYRGFILNSLGLRADFLSLDYFKKQENTLRLSDIFESEKHWARKHSILFYELSKTDFKNKDFDLSESKIKITNRKYFVNNSALLETQECIKNRYKCNKYTENYAINSAKEETYLQHTFNL